MFNMGAIGSIIMVSFRATWFMSKLDSRVEHIEIKHKDDIDAAFEKIRLLMKCDAENNTK